MFWQENAEPGALVWLAANVSGPSVLVYNPLHQAQSKTNTFDIFGTGRVRAIKAFKNVW